MTDEPGKETLNSSSDSGLSQEAKELLLREERARWDEEQKKKDMEAKAKEFEKIEAERKAEEERLKLEEEEKKKELEEKGREFEKIEAAKKAEADRLKKEEEERLKLEEEEKKRELEKKGREFEKIEAAKKAEADRLKKEEEEREKKEKVRKEVLKEEKEKAKGTKKGGVLKYVIGFILIVLIAGVAGAFLTFSAVAAPGTYGTNYPYAAQYEVFLPDSQSVTIAGVDVLGVTSGNDVTLKVGNDRRTIAIGATTTFPGRHLTVKSLGITLVDADIMYDVTYRGVAQNKLNFLVNTHSSQVPPQQFIIGMIIPSSVSVRAV